MGLDKHAIAKSINSDFNKILKSNEMVQFQKGLEYKSPKTAEVDKAIVQLLLTNLEVYKNGWIMANASKTINLSQKETNANELFYEFRRINDALNQFLKSISGIIPKEKINALRGLELEIRELEKNISL